MKRRGGGWWGEGVQIDPPAPGKTTLEKPSLIRDNRSHPNPQLARSFFNFRKKTGNFTVLVCCQQTSTLRCQNYA